MKAITAKPAALGAVSGLVALLGLIVAFSMTQPARADGGTASSSVTSVVFKQVSLTGLVVIDEHIKVDHKSPTKGAQWFKTCMNSSTVLGQYHGSHIVQYVDHHCLLQRDSHSPTGWVKRGGGASGRDCRNIAAPPAVKMPFPKVTHFVSVSSATSLKVKVFVTATAHAEVHASCGSASGNGSSSDWITVSYAALLRARSNLSLREQLAAKIVAKATDKATAKAAVNCVPGSTTVTTNGTTTVVTTTTGTTTTFTTTTTTTTTNTTTTTPPPHFTNLTCQGQEEVTGGASSTLVCSVSNDNGAQISLSVKVLTNKGNLLVSGIQCSSQGGTPACQGSGTFEIRLAGVNDTTAPIYSDLEVVATSNGTDSKPFDQTYKVDPSCSNFGC